MEGKVYNNYGRLRHKIWKETIWLSIVELKVYIKREEEKEIGCLRVKAFKITVCCSG